MQDALFAVNPVNIDLYLVFGIGINENKLASLEATLVQNSAQRLTY